ncbi:MAG: hypothetical protein O3B13_09675 [Planctomycetota bacterium]|nr:hypothetical protein [Planctomycetota bacterium]MDA1163359.1 hypothetical protein [Planctomycetota bacterium]
MQHPFLITWLILSIAAAVTPAAFAQQFRVYTEVSVLEQDAQPGKTHGDVVARSLTIFHAGRVFDWLETAGEVTIFEEAHERFVIFNGRKLIATKVDFKEIERRLASAHDETSNHAVRLLTRDDRDAKSIATSLKFQLNPNFKHSFQQSTLQLDLDSPQLEYHVSCGTTPISEAVDAYLNYADWTAKLNHVMHPRSLYPAPRLQLNESLRKHNVLPVKVQLRVEFDRPIVLQADHRFAWQLEKIDRESIQFWEAKLHDESLQWLSFHDYQRAILKTTEQVSR